MLRVIISPAKKMLAGLESPVPLEVPAMLDRSRELLDLLLSMGDDELQALWKVSDRLLGPCLDALRELGRDGLPGEGAAVSRAVARGASLLASPAEPLDLASRPAFPAEPNGLGHPLASPAVLSYSGIQYQSMAPAVMDASALSWLSDHLRIVSGLYGCLRPFDAVAPYRLEMGARMPAGRRWPGGARTLYDYWGDAIAREACSMGDAPGYEGSGVSAGNSCGCEVTSALVAEPPAVCPSSVPCGKPSGPQGMVGLPAHGSGSRCLAGPFQFVNLASVEYAKAVIPRLSSEIRVTTCLFAEGLRDGRPVQRSTASKAARGSMVRWMAEHGVVDAGELRAFDVGYRLVPDLCHEEGAGCVLVFLRS